MADDLVLYGEDVRGIAVEAVGPDMAAGLAVDQLRVDANAIAGAPHAALQHVANSELASHLPNIDRAALVGEHRVAGDHEQPRYLG